MGVQIPRCKEAILRRERGIPLWSIGTVCGYLCKNSWTIWVVGSDGPRESCVRLGVQIPHGQRQFWGKGTPIVKYGDTLWSPVRKQLNQSWRRLGCCGLGWSEGSRSSIVFSRWRQCAHMGWQIGATWRIRLNFASVAPRRFYVKLLWPLVVIQIVQTNRICKLWY